MGRGLILVTIVWLLLGGLYQCGGGKTTQKPEKSTLKTTAPVPIKKDTPSKPAAKPTSTTTPSAQQVTTSVQTQPQVKPQQTTLPQPEPRPDTVRQEIRPVPQPPKVETSFLPDTASAALVQPIPPDTSAAVTQPDTSIESEAVPEEEIAAKYPPPLPPPFIRSNELFIDDIYFDENQSAHPSSSFNPNYWVSLGKVLRILRDEPLCHIRLKGHIGTSEKGKSLPDLDLKRAVCVGRLLLEMFPDSLRKTIAQRLEPVAVGDEDPLVATTHKVSEALNRRVSFELVCDEIPAKTMGEYLEVRDKARQPQKKQVPKTKTAVKPASVSTSPITVLYDNGLRLYEKRRLDEAINIFQEVVDLNPNHSLADNAQWWKGEALYQQGNYQQALEAYQRVFDLGDRNKAAYAQLRIGYCLWRLEQKSAALAAFRQVLDRYPGATEEVSKARKMVQILSQE